MGVSNSWNPQGLSRAVQEMSYFFTAEVQFHLLTLALEKDLHSASRPGRLTPGNKPSHSLNRKLCGSQSRSGVSQKSSFPAPRSEPRVARCKFHTDFAIPVTSSRLHTRIILNNKQTLKFQTNNYNTL
jgi:hypothetical protein